MKYFNELLIKLQTLDIQIKQIKRIRHDQEQMVNFYDISHETPELSPSYRNQLRELKELAITDILNLRREQIHFQLQRLENLEEMFQMFWNKYYHSPFRPGSEHNFDLVISLNLNHIFICPFLSFMDYAEVNDNFLDDLESTIRHRQEVLKEFEQAVWKVINPPKEPESSAMVLPATTKTRPAFKAGIADEFFSLVKEYFSEPDRERLKNIMTSTDFSGKPILFNGPGNQLADAFKQLFDANLIVGCNKAELENWILQNFKYRDKGAVKSYTEKYLQDLISSNTKACQSPIFDVRKNSGQFYLYPLTRNYKNPNT